MVQSFEERSDSFFTDYLKTFIERSYSDNFSPVESKDRHRQRPQSDFFLSLLTRCLTKYTKYDFTEKIHSSLLTQQMINKMKHILTCFLRSEDRFFNIKS